MMNKLNIISLSIISSVCKLLLRWLKITQLTYNYHFSKLHTIKIFPLLTVHIANKRLYMHWCRGHYQDLNALRPRRSQPGRKNTIKMVKFYSNFHHTWRCKAAVYLHTCSSMHLYPESDGRVDYYFFFGGGALT